LIDWGTVSAGVGVAGACAAGARWVWGRYAAGLAAAKLEGIALAQRAAADAESRTTDASISQRLDTVVAEVKAALAEARTEARESHAQLGRDLSGLRETQAAHSVQLAEVRSDVRGIRDSMATVEERRKATSDRVARVEADAKAERRELWAAVDDLRRAGR